MGIVPGRSTRPLGVAMKDFTIDAAKWHMNDPLGDAVLIDHEMSWRPIIAFLQANRLLRAEEFGTNWKSWKEFEIRASDLTDEGLALVRRCMSKWAKSVSRIDIGHKTPEKMMKRVEIWANGLAAMRNGDA
jgi:hypothetical protein